MNENDLDRVRILLEKFYFDREMEGLSLSTVKADRTLMKYFLSFLMEGDESEVTAITGETMRRYQAWLYGRMGRAGRPLTMVGQYAALVSVRKFFQWLVRRSHILSDPTTAIVLPKQRRGLPKPVMTRREMDRLLAAPDVDKPLGLRDRAILELLYSTGLRNSEARNLRIGDVDVMEGEVTVRRGKGGKDRVVPLGTIAGKYVAHYMKEARAKILNGREDPGYLFVSRNKRRLCAASLQKVIVDRYARWAKVKKNVTPHMFRHTCATHMLRGRADIRHIQALLGHARLDTTQVYTRVEVGDLKRELKRCHPRERPR